MMRKTLSIIFVSLLLFYSCGKSDKPAEGPQKPAQVENAAGESSLSTVTLSLKAEERLGIELSPVENKILPGTFELGGEIIAVPGTEARVSAPVPGIVLSPSTGIFPQAGKDVKRGEAVLRLLLLPPESNLLGAREEVAVRKEELSVVQAKADRAKQLLASKAIAEKTYEEIQAELARSKASLSVAEARLNLLSGKDLVAAAENLSTLVLESPVDGILQRIFVAPGQTVPGSTDLFEVVSFHTVWVRVPVYIGDLDRIDRKKAAIVKPLGDKQESAYIQARPVQGPPLSDPSSASADLFFEISGNERPFRIGQKVRLSLIKKTPEESLVVPLSAILYDMNGGSWVYVKVGPRVYSRHRVEVSHVVEDFAVLIRGVGEGDDVVTAGAAEIFGTEFGVGK